MIGYVYKIESDCKSICYIGSTIRELNRRFSSHKSKYSTCILSRYLDNTDYNFSNGCKLLKSYEIIDEKHLLAYEQLWMNKFKNSINVQPAFFILYKDKFSSQKYYEDNKDKIRERQKEYRKQNKDKEKERHKKYYEVNKDKEKERHKKYEELNKERNKEKRTKKWTCECGGSYTSRHKNDHLKTKKHISFLTSIKTA